MVLERRSDRVLQEFESDLDELMAIIPSVQYLALKTIWEFLHLDFLVSPPAFDAYGETIVIKWGFGFCFEVEIEPDGEVHWTADTSYNTQGKGSFFTGIPADFLADFRDFLLLDEFDAMHAL